LKLTPKHIKTMRERLGEYSELCDNDQYLPMFRNRQVHYPELFAFSAELAKRKDNPARYMAALWGAKTLAKTLDWLQKLINLAKSKVAEFAREKMKHHEERKAQKALENPMNRENRRRLEKMMRSKKLFGELGSLQT
jgi:predicted secreted Zn-dependent protease